MPNNSVHRNRQQLWLTKISDDTFQIEKTTRTLLSASEKQRLNATKSDKRKREFLLSRALMRHAFSQLFQQPLDYWHFINTTHSAPVISNLPKDIYFSLSHSNGVICFITSPSPVGIDIEKTPIERNFLDSAELFMSSDECKQLKASDKNKIQTNFYRVWCAKEAYFKAISTIALNDLKKINILEQLEHATDWHLTENYIDDYLISIVTKDKEQLPVETHWF